MGDLDLDALEATARAATPGPWKFPGRNWPGVVMTRHGCLWNPHNGQINDDTNAAYVAAFDPPTTLALIATIKDVEALLPKWTETRAYNAEAFTTGGIGMMREIDYAGDLARILTRHQDKRENGSER